MEPGSLVMKRKMLLGIKERAERFHRARPAVSSTILGARTLDQL